MPKLTQNQEPVTLYYGADPGKSGGIACQARSRSGSLKAVGWIVMPPSPLELIQSIRETRDLHKPDAEYMVLESVHSMPKQGVKSMFTFGRGLGRLEMLPAFFNMTLQELRPQAWMKQLNIPPGSSDLSKPEQKERLRLITQKMFPKLDLWKRTLGEQRAVCDALLMSEVCYRLFRGNNNA